MRRYPLMRLATSEEQALRFEKQITKLKRTAQENLEVFASSTLESILPNILALEEAREVFFYQKTKVVLTKLSVKKCIGKIKEKISYDLRGSLVLSIDKVPLCVEAIAQAS